MWEGISNLESSGDGFTVAVADPFPLLRQIAIFFHFAPEKCKWICMALESK